MINTVVAYPKTVLAFFLVATVFFGWHARSFEINASANTLIADDNIHYIQTQLVNHRFASDEFLLLVYKPDSGAVFSQASFDDLRSISARLLTLERVASVRHLLNVPLLSQQQGMLAENDATQYSQENLQLDTGKLAEIFRDHPVFENLIINEDQTALAIQVLFKPDTELSRIEGEIAQLQRRQLEGELSDELSNENRKQLQQLDIQAEPIRSTLRDKRNEEVQAIQKIADDYRHRASVYLGGEQVLAYELINIIKSDLVLFGAVIGAAICLVLVLLFRRVRWVVIPVLCCVCSGIITIGAFGLLALKATVISSTFIALQLILTLAIVIHLIVQYREDAAADSDSTQAELVTRSLAKKVAPCFYAGLTTSVGFASLMLSGIKPVVDFGWMMVVAMFVSIACSLLLFPALHMLFRREHKQAGNSLFRRFIHACLGIARARLRLVVIASALMAVAGTAGLFRLTVENSFIDYFRSSTPIYQQLHYVDQEFGGSTPLDLVYNIPPEQQDDMLVMTADTARTLQRIQQQLGEYPAVGKLLSVVNFTELAKLINDGKPLTEYELTALYWTIDKTVRSSLIGSFFDAEHQQLRISARIKDSTEGLNRKQLLQDIHNELAALGIEQDEYQLSNLFILYQDMLERLFKSQILTLALVLVVLGLMFAVIFKSVRIALIAVLPNSLAALAVLGTMGWLGIPLDFMSITIAAIAIGIAVDDTIHYLHRYLQEIERETTDTALANTHNGVGYAMLYTTLIVVMGFSLLAFSDFIPSVTFGLLTGLGIAIALISNLTLLPTLLKRFVGAKPGTGAP